MEVMREKKTTLKTTKQIIFSVVELGIMFINVLAYWRLASGSKYKWLGLQVFVKREMSRF